jgi:hypothetical protein
MNHYKAKAMELEKQRKADRPQVLICLFRDFQQHDFKSAHTLDRPQHTPAYISAIVRFPRPVPIPSAEPAIRQSISF